MLGEYAREHALRLLLGEQQVLERHLEPAQRSGHALAPPPRCRLAAAAALSAAVAAALSAAVAAAPQAAGCSEEAWVGEECGRAHHGGAPRRGQRPLRVGARAHVAVCDDGDGQRPPDRRDLIPISRALVVPLLAPPAVHRHRRGARLLQHESEGHGVLHLGQDAHLARDWHLERGHQACDELAHALRLLEEEGAVAALLGAALRAAEVDVDPVAAVLHQPRRGDQLVQIRASQLHEQRPVEGTGQRGEPGVLRGRAARVGVFRVRRDRARQKGRGGQHGRVAELAAVPPCQETVRQLALQHHGRHDEARRTERLAPPALALLEREAGHPKRAARPSRAAGSVPAAGSTPAGKKGKT